MGATDEHLRASGGISYLNDVDLDAVTLFELFGLDALIRGKHGFRKFAVGGDADGDASVARLDMGDDAGQDLMFLGGELLKDEAALGFAYALDDDLLCSLSRDAAELLGLHRHADDIADLRTLADLLCRLKIYLKIGILNFLNDSLFHDHVYALLVLVKNDFNIVRAVRIVTAEGREHCLINFVVHVASGNALFLLDIFYGFKKFCVHFYNPFYIVACSLTCATCDLSNSRVSLPDVIVTLPLS